jgi:hypothetical protein
MYQLVMNILNIPTQSANSTVTYVAGAILLTVTVVIIDLVYRLLRSVIKIIDKGV